MADEEGASPSELILEASRRNNTDLLAEVLTSLTTSPSPTLPPPPPSSDLTPSESLIAHLLNTTRDGWGNAPLHIAARAGAYEALDILLDQPGVETDPLTRDLAETPLHKAVEWENSQWAPGSAAGGEGDGEEESMFPVVAILLDAGCDPRIRSGKGRKAVDLVDARNEALRAYLRRSEIMLTEVEGMVGADAGAGVGAGLESLDGPPSDDEEGGGESGGWVAS